MLAFLAARAVAGVELVGATYCRAHGAGWIEVSHQPGCHALRMASWGEVGDAGARVGRVFDLTADTGAVDAALSRDKLLGPLVARRAGLRTPGAWDGFELAVRAVLGQQVTLAAARGLAAQLAALCGPAVATAGPDLTHAFPDAAAVASADLAALGMPASRRTTLRTIAMAALDDPGLFAPPLRPGHAAQLMALPGIGDWTAQYVLLRAVRDADAFPASDVGLLRAMDAGGRAPDT